MTTVEAHGHGLRVACEPGPVTGVRVRVAGDVDLRTAQRLGAVLCGVAEAGAPRLEVDLSRVTFFSCAGLSALMAARRAGADVAVVATSTPVDKLLDLLDVGGLFKPAGRRA